MKKVDMKNKENIINGIILILLLLVTLVVMQRYSFLDYADDLVYKNTFLKYKDLFSWGVDFYNNWGGRVVIMGLLVVLLNSSVIIWRIFIPVTILVLFLFLRKIINQIYNSLLVSNILSIALVVLLWIWQSEYGIVWATGSVNYILPGSGLVAALFPFINLFIFNNGFTCSENKVLNILLWILSIFGGFFDCSFEQAGAILICTILILYSLYLITKKKIVRISSKVYILFCFYCVCATFSIIAPGNRVRAEQELYWGHVFKMFSFTDKLILGLENYINYFYSRPRLIILLISYLCFIIVALYQISKSKNIFTSIHIMTIMSGILLNIVTKLIEQPQGYVMNPYDRKDLLLLVVFGLTIIINALNLLIYGWIYSKNLGCLFVVLYLASVVSSTIVGLSPSIYVSGERVFFMSVLLQLLICVMVVAENLELFRIKFHSENVNNSKLILSTVLVCLSVYIIFIGCFLSIWRYQDRGHYIENVDLIEKESIYISDYYEEKTNDFYKLSIRSKDTDSWFEYNNWVNGNVG